MRSGTFLTMRNAQSILWKQRGLNVWRSLNWCVHPHSLCSLYRTRSCKAHKARTLWVHTLFVENEVLPCFFSLSNGLVAGRNISISSGTFLMILKADSTACKQITRNIELLGASFYNARPVFHASCSSLHAALLIKIQHSYNMIKA